MGNSGWWRCVVALCALLILDCSSESSGWRSVLEVVGVVDPIAPPPEVLLVLCDGSFRSSCTPDTLAATVGAVIDRAALRPESTIVLWRLGADVGRSAMLREVRSPPSDARRSRTAAWVAAARQDLLLAAAPYFRERPPRRSPLAETLTKVALSIEGERRHVQLIVVSNAHEVSGLGDFTCRMPKERDWLAGLRAAGALSPSKLAGADVHFTHVVATPRDRCSVDIRREQRVRDRWRTALLGAGAATVTFSTGPVAFIGEPTTTARR